MKFALMSYDYTINLGNEIQSIAARRFLPKIDYLIDHEKLDGFKSDTDVKMIMNGWYLDCLDAWPPSRNIDPLLVSMHFSQNDKIKEVILSDESRQYFDEFGPVGCRDAYTMNFLRENDIDAYFSGCLTLTLDTGGKYNPKDEENDYILVSHDQPEELVKFLKEKTDKKIYVINQDYPPTFDKAYPESISKYLYNYTTFYSFKEKMFIAENYLRLYENASCIITDRLHCALPSLALKTPVLLFNSRKKQERFEGLNDLVNTSTLEAYIDDYNIFDVENPPENPTEYLKIRKNLIEKCKKFTGHISESCFSDTTFNEMLDNNTLYISRHSYESRAYIKNVLKRMGKDERIISEQQKTIENQKKEIEDYKKQLTEKDKIIDEYRNSKSWKITSPLRKIRK